MAEVRTRILLAAGPVFADLGFRAATVREICAKANVNVASINYYFGDKQQLYIATIGLAHSRRSAELPIPQRPQGTPAQLRLRDFVFTMLTRIGAMSETPPWETRLLMRELLRPTDACRDLVEDYFRPHFHVLLGILAELSDHPQPVLRKIGFSVIGQCLFYRVAAEVVTMLTPAEELADYSREQLSNHITNMVLSALGAQPPLREVLQAPTHESSVPQ